MKIKILNLLRYGHFENRELELALDGLTIVYGPNEAGKSTSLAAITDLLYGFNRSCPYNFRWDNNQLRVGGTLVNRAGDELSFIRRKANANTVMAEEGSPLADSALLPFVGGTRIFFENSFGLSHDRLREGGDAIERAEGDLGQILFEAGSGITSLAEIQKLLDAEGDSIFGPRKKKGRVLYETLDEYEAARASLRESTLNHSTWKRAENDLAAATEALSAVHSRASKLRIEQDELNRWREMLPLLGELDRMREELAALGAETALPERARERFAAAVELRSHHRPLVERMEQDLAEARQKESECIVDETLLTSADRVQQLYEKASLMENEMEALPGLETGLATLKRQMAQLMERFSLPMVDGQPHLPRQSIITELSELIATYKELERDLEQGQQAEDLAAGELELLKKDVAILGDISDPRSDLALLKMQTTALAKVAQPARLERDLARSQSKIAKALGSLDWWDGDVIALVAAKLPTPTQIAGYQDGFSRLQSKIDKLAERLEENRDELAAARHRLLTFSRRETFPTEGDLQQAREQRQAAWALVRGVLDGKPAPTAEELAALGAETKLAPTYENLVETADGIADGRFRSVEKIVQHDQFQADVEAGEQAVAALEEKLETAEAELGSTTEQWHSLWEPVGITPGTPEEMKEGLATVTAISEELETQRELTEELGGIQKTTDNLRAQLQAIAARWTVALEKDTPAEVAAEQVQIALDSQQELYSRAETLRARTADREQILVKAQQRNQSLRRKRVDWQTRWAQCCVQANLDTGLSATAAGDMVEAWATLRQHTEQQAALSEQIQTAQARLAAYTDAVKAALEPLGQPAGSIATPAAAVAAVRDYHHRVAREQRQAQQRETIVTQVQAIQTMLADHRQKLLEAETEISSLLELARVETEEELPQAMRDAETQRKLRNDVDQARQRLLATSEGDDEAAIRARAAGHTLATIRSKSDEISLQLTALEGEIARTAASETAARHALDQLNQKGDAHLHAQTMQNAIAKMEVQSRDYLRLRAASILLRHGIERIREKHKNPILTKASGFFRTITGGSFQALITDYENEKPTIVGVKDDGTRVYTTGMSTGTRDQLYLALRLAFVDEYCATEEPLPFIGDDLFVQSDEVRTTATLQVLAQLTNCQVILFAHHHHVVECARKALPSAKIIYLSQAPAMAG